MKRSCAPSPPTAAASTATSPTIADVTAAVNRAVQFGFSPFGRFRRRQGQRVPAGQPDRRHRQPRRGQRRGRRHAPEHQHHRDARWAAPAAAQQHDDHRRLHAARLRRGGQSLPDLQAGGGFDQADRLEVRQRWHAGCGRISTAGRRWPVWRGRSSDPNTRNIYTFIPNGSGGGSTVAFTTANATPAGHAPRRDRCGDADCQRARAAARRGDRIDAGVDGRAVARSAARHRLRLSELDRHLRR